MNVKGLLSVGLAIVATPALSQETSVMNFDLDTAHWEEFDQDWRYARPFDQNCNYLEAQAKLCKGSHRFYMYYNGHNNDHIGWMRYGYFEPTDALSIAGNAFRFVYTGGVKSDGNGGTQELGEPIYGFYQFLEKYSELGDGVYADGPLPGTPSLYYQDQFSGVTSLGLFDNVNRFTMHTWQQREENPYLQRERYNADIGRPTRTLAWYPFIDSARSSHYYHHVSNRAFGGWLKAEFDGNPTHTNAGITNPNGSLPEGGDHYPYDAYSYFENVASFAVRFLGARDSDSPFSVVSDEWTKSEVKYENDYTISSLGVGYDPVTGNFDISFEDKYRCIECAAKYEVRYSFSPINTGNFAVANEFEAVKNFYFNDDNEAGEITKANNGYNQNWAYLVLPYEDALRFKSGERIYFAVKDISDRQFSYDPKDDEIVQTPWGDFRKRDLVRSLSVDYHESPVALDKLGNPVEYVPIGGQVGFSIQSTVSGAIKFTDNPPLYDDSPYLKSTWMSFGEAPVETSQYCGVDLECHQYELANLVENTVGTNEFSALSQKTVEMAVEDKDGNPTSASVVYDQFIVTGEGVALNPQDTVTFTLKNVSGESANITPRVTSYIHGRPDLMNSNRYYQLTKAVPSGQEVQWTVPATDFAGDRLNSVLISIPQSEGYELTSIVLNTAQELSCFECGSLLVDYFVDSSAVHEFGYDSWTNVVSDKYTKQIGDGFGIAVGSNAGYDSVAITGSTQLTDNSAVARVVWLNNSDQVYVFTPRYNLEQVGRINETTTPWYDSEQLVIEPGGSAEQIVPIDSSTRVINVNVGINNPGHLILDKISVSAE